MAISNFSQVDVSEVSGFSVAGVPITATPAEINNVADGVTATGAEITRVVGGRAAMDADGLSYRGVARVTFDAGIVANRSIAPHAMSVSLPAHAVITGGFFDVNTAFTSAGGNAGTIAIHVEGANDIQTAAAVSGAPYSTIGRKAIVPKANTPESTSVKTTVARAVTFTVAIQALTAGKLTLFLDYVVSVASA